jgi:acyl-CoA synthetase (AMP-forming)/AMP-acid ligase II
VLSAFYDNLKQHSENVALVAGDRQVSYGELLEEAENFAERLGPARALVFLEALNTVESIAAYLGCLIGAHPVYLFSGRDWQKTAALAERYKPNVVWRWRSGSLEEDRPCEAPHELHPDLRVLLSTSGSTGTPKFVKLSGKNIHANALSICEYLRLDTRERALTSLQFNYSYGMSVVNSHLACGASLALTDLSVIEREFWDLFGQVGATSFAGVPYTFEMLDRAAFPWAKTRGLRYATQAGGRLAPALVSQLARVGEENGWRFYVMYGQTEASPRIAYLPPDRAAEFSHCIGMPVPGGEIDLIDEAGNPVLVPDVPGELTYRGPNVMMGYAHDSHDLSSDCTPARLLTDDIACRNGDGLFYIVGRKSRLVKPFGIRVNLDEVQNQARQWIPGCALAGTDERIVVAFPRSVSPVESEQLVSTLASMYHLPAFMFSVVVVDELPLLETGKTDYRRLLELAARDREESVARVSGAALPDWLSVLLSPDFYRGAFLESARILGLAKEEWEGVAHIYRTFVSAQGVDAGSTFSSLSGDSLSYVQTYLALEDYLGSVPDDWENLTVDELEGRADALAL